MGGDFLNLHYESRVAALERTMTAQNSRARYYHTQHSVPSFPMYK
jgi:hypothetical protein